MNIFLNINNYMNVYFSILLSYIGRYICGEIWASDYYVNKEKWITEFYISN
jgi:hypothetical protein